MVLLFYENIFLKKRKKKKLVKNSNHQISNEILYFQ